jgi:ubiquitin-protein ligase
MQAYQIDALYKVNILQKINFIQKLFEISFINSIKLLSKYIEISFNVNKKFYDLKIHYEKNKPIFIFASLNNLDKFENELGEKLNNINLQIDNYERVEDVLYDIITTFIEINNNSVKHNLVDNIQTPKNEKVFKENIEIHKSNLKKTVIDNKILSSNSLIEMLGDQLIKLYSNKNYYVNMTDLKNFNIEMSNFKLSNPENTDITNLKVNIIVKISDDIISSPPKIQLISNYIFKNNILSVIEKLRPFSDTKMWSIKYSIYDTTENIYQMINKYGEMDSVAKSELDSLLTELEYLLSIKSNNISENKLLLEFDEILANELAGFIDNTNKKTSYWKSGIGYGHSNTSAWNIDEYETALKNRKTKINEKINIVFSQIDKLTKLELFEITKLKSVFKQYIFDDELDSKIISNISSIIVKYYEQFNDKTFLSEIMKQIKEYLEDNKIEHPITKLVRDNIIDNTKLDEYQKIFNDSKFKYFDGDFKSFHYSKDTIVNLSSTQVSRIQKEFQILKKSITLHKDASIFFCIQKNNVNKIRFMISGPKNTPYEYGLFIFDMTMSSDFPSKPPLVNFSNNGGKRFNPNLYDSGKVCLSLLGTWRGDKGESWNSAISTFNQLVISIQSQIMIDEPYFNEPGYEKTIGTENGKKMSSEYNYNIRQYTLDHTINNLLENNNYPEFQDIIKKYFKYQKNDIIKTLNKWLEEMPSSKTVTFQKSYTKFTNLIDKL